MSIFFFCKSWRDSVVVLFQSTGSSSRRRRRKAAAALRRSKWPDGKSQQIERAIPFDR
jgi:hypothetical protein